MKLDSIYRTVFNTYSGKKAKQFTARIYRYNRWITHPKYQKGALCCRDILKKVGADSTQLLKFPIDGKRCYGNWKTPKYWNVTKAYLKLKINGKWKTFADYKKIPASIFVYSAPTRGEIRTKLVAFDCKNLKGKLVFCHPNDDTQLRFETRNTGIRGGRGIVTDFAPNWKGVRSNRDFRNGHRWDNATLFEAKKTLAGFSLSRNQGIIIRKELKKKGAIECRFQVAGKLGPGKLYCTTGTIRGSRYPNEEVVLAAHLYEAGANDNGSGVAAGIEAMHAIKSLIKRKKIPPPLRTIRVIFTFEIVGFLAYFEYIKDQNRKYIAGVNPDMAGEDQKKCKSTLNIYQSPDSNATFADPLLMDFMIRSAGNKLKYAIRKFIVNDNIISDLAIGIPCPALIHLRDRFYHSNEDNMDKVSAYTLKRVGGAIAAYMYAAASINPSTAPDIAALCRSYALDRLRRGDQAGISREKLDHMVEVECERINSIERSTGLDLRYDREKLQEVKSSIKTTPSKKQKLPAVLVNKAKRIVPVRKVIGPFTLEHIPFEKRCRLKFQPVWSGKLNLPVFWADGKRNLFEIFQKACNESGPYDLKEFIEYFLFLEKEKLIKIKRCSN
jgi:hypothetical protein